MGTESELERLVRDRTRQLEDVNESLRRSEQIHATDIENLQRVATQSTPAHGVDGLYEQILDTALLLLRADLVSIQRFYPERGTNGELRLLGHRGFSEEAAKRWEWVSQASHTVCGEALRTGQRIIVSDVRTCSFLRESEDLEGYLGAGVRSAQTFPLISRSGALLGMVSAYWCEVREPSQSEIRAFDILARLAADAIERSRADDRLRAALQQLQLITNNMPAGVSRCSRDLRFLWVSRSYAAWLGKPEPEAIVGRYISDVVGQEGFETLRPYIEKALSGERVEFETRVTYMGPGRRWIQAVYVPTKNQDRKVDGWIAVVNDVTNRHEAEDRLRQSEERFRRMADTAPVMVWISGRDKLCTFFNKTWLDFTGRTMEQEFGNGWADGIHPDDMEQCFAVYTSSFEARRRFQMEYRLRRADGAYRWLLDQGVPLFEPKGVFQGYVGSCIDITDLKLAQQKTLGRQKLESVGLLAAGIAHDFGNLMGAIIAGSDLALSEMNGSSSAAAEEVKRIQTTAFRASEIVRELMVYSGQETARQEQLQISRLVEEMAELLKSSISKHVTLELHCEKDLPEIRGNASQIRQVVMNLIINGSEAIGKTIGVIKVSASHVTGGRELAPGSALELSQGDYIRLEVSDTGRGMTEQERTRIFDPFFTTKSTGRGLGLAVVQGIVRGHDGAIDVLSTPGHGTTFRIFIPSSAQAEPEKTAAAVPRARGRSAAGTVLLVEDEESLRVTVAKILRKERFAVIEAVDGASAIDLLFARKQNIDLILLDLSIPGKTSREVITAAYQIRPETKVVIMSAHNEDLSRRLVDFQKTAAFIRKPFRLVELVQMIREIQSPLGSSASTA